MIQILLILLGLFTISYYFFQWHYIKPSLDSKINLYKKKQVVKAAHMNINSILLPIGRYTYNYDHVVNVSGDVEEDDELKEFDYPDTEDEDENVEAEDEAEDAENEL